MTTYRLEDAQSWLANVHGGMRQAALRGMVSAANRTVAYIQNEVIPQVEPSPVARGVYRAGWRAEPLPNGAEVVNTVPHAGFIEYGVRGASVKIGRQMILALTEWVRMKGIGGSTSKSGRRTKATLEEANQIAWAVAKSLQKRGIFAGGKGLGVLKRAMEMVPQFVREEVAREMRREFTGG